MYKCDEKYKFSYVGLTVSVLNSFLIRRPSAQNWAK